jgi:alpha-tubulin suppressor-like RCC1 family protein
LYFSQLIIDTNERLFVFALSLSPFLVLDDSALQSLEGEECDEIICGAEYTIAVSHSKQKIWSWGWGDFGRLGHGNPFDLFLPKQISSLCNIKIKLVACGDSHTMVVTGAGEVFSFGRNQNGQLGLGSRIDCMIPTKIVELGAHKVESVGCGAEHTAACTEGGKVFSWGWGLYGNLGLGDNQDRLVPTEVSTFTQNKTHVKTVACGWRHTCAVSDKGELFTFGWSKYGQLGHGDNETSDIPKKVAAVEGATVTQVSGGWRHTMALDSDGKVYACGWNQYGQVSRY